MLDLHHVESHAIIFFFIAKLSLSLVLLVFGPHDGSLPKADQRFDGR